MDDKLPKKINGNKEINLLHNHRQKLFLVLEHNKCKIGCSIATSQLKEDKINTTLADINYSKIKSLTKDM